MSWIKEPGEHVKLIRTKLTKLKDKMEKKATNTKNRHLEEISAIRNIFCEDRCLEYSEGHLDIEVIFDIHPALPKNEIQASYVYEDSENKKMPLDFGSIFLEHLPPIRLYLKLPASYPLKQSPDFTLDIAWLTPWESSKICQQLDEYWRQNAGSEILFIWIDFLKNHLFNFLNIEEKLDISFQFAFHQNNNRPNLFYQDINRLKDPRVSKPLCQCPIEFLQKFDNTKRIQLFEKNGHFCEICLEQNSGVNCEKLKNCKHIFCRKCLVQYLNVKIRDGKVAKILCPENKCKIELEFEEVKKFCDDETFAKFEQLLLQKTINLMKDTIYCARKLCGYPVIRDNLEDNLATCALCKYSFCVYCRKVYHGITPCKMSNSEKEKLINEYQSASQLEKKKLELRYGKKQIELIVERFLTQKYLKKNTKQCPNCLTSTSKTQGCNKMNCSYCQKCFCWLCGKIIDLENPYEHYTRKNACAGRLFDGIIKEHLDFLNEFDIQANLRFFEMRDANA